MKEILIFLFPFFVAESFAYDFMEKGLAYNIKKDGTLALTYKNPKVQKEFRDAARARDFKKLDTLKWWKGGYAGSLIIPATVKHKGRTYKVTEIGDSACISCYELTSVKIPEGIKRIGYAAFYSAHITSINIPASVIYLKPGCIQLCKRLAKVTVSPANKKYCSVNNCIYNKKKTELFLVSTSVRNYTVPASVTTLLDYAFSCTKRMNKLFIPKTVKYVGGDVGVGIEGSYRPYKIISRAFPKQITPCYMSNMVDDFFLEPCDVVGNYYRALTPGGVKRPGPVKKNDGRKLLKKK